MIEVPSLPMKINHMIVFLTALLIGCASSPVAQPSEASPECVSGEACLMEGMKWESGFGRVPKAAKAAKLYQRACDLGELLGCYNLGVMLQSGSGVTRDVEMAKKYYKKGCTGGQQNACVNAAFLRVVEEGEDALEDAAMVYGHACEQGVMVACSNLADMHQGGRAVAQDMGLAASLFKKACYGGQNSGCIRWAWLHAQGCGPKNQCERPAQDERMAAALVAEDCEAKGPAYMCVAYGLHLEAGRLLKRNLAKARTLYKRACDEGEPWGCERLANTLISGRGGPKDVPTGERLFDDACAKGFAPACVQLASIHLSAMGSDAQDSGVDALKRGCALGEATACNTLRLLCYAGTETACPEVSALSP